MRFRHLVFDLDGTLADTKDDLAEAVNVTLRALGFPAQDPQTLYAYVGHGARAMVASALGAERADFVDRAMAVFMPWYRAHLLDHCAVYPGLREVIHSLAEQGVVFSILTNKPEDMSLAIVRGLGLAQYFRRVVGGDTMLTRKPDPSGLVQLVAAAGVPADQTLMVGDSSIDVATGRRAGVGTCGVVWGFGGLSVADAGPDVLIAGPHELLAICRNGF